MEIIKYLLNEYIKFYEAHNCEVGALDRQNFKQWVYLYHSDHWVLSCALTDKLFEEILKEIKG